MMGDSPQKLYYHRNKEKCRAYSKEYYRRTHTVRKKLTEEQRKQHRKQYYDTHPEAKKKQLRHTTIKNYENRENYYLEIFNCDQNHTFKNLFERFPCRLAQANKLEKLLDDIDFDESEIKGNHIARALIVKLSIMRRRYLMTLTLLERMLRIEHF